MQTCCNATLCGVGVYPHDAALHVGEHRGIYSVGRHQYIHGEHAARPPSGPALRMLHVLRAAVAAAVAAPGAVCARRHAAIPASAAPAPLQQPTLAGRQREQDSGLVRLDALVARLRVWRARQLRPAERVGHRYVPRVRERARRRAAVELRQVGVAALQEPGREGFKGGLAGAAGLQGRKTACPAEGQRAQGEARAMSHG